MRLHELAKKHGFNQQDLLTAVQKAGFDVKDSLSAVEREVEVWVANQADGGWIPPPPDKKVVRKKKVAPLPAKPPAPAPAPAAKPVIPVKTESAPAASPAAAKARATEAAKPSVEHKVEPAGEPVARPEAPKPEAKVEPKIEEKSSKDVAAKVEAKEEKAVDKQELQTQTQPATKPEPVMETATKDIHKASDQTETPVETAKDASVPSTQPQPAPQPAPPPPVVQLVRPAAVEIKGSAAVGQVSAQTMEAIRRANAPAARSSGGRGQASGGRGQTPGRPQQSTPPGQDRRPAPTHGPRSRQDGERGGAGHPGRSDIRVEAVPADADLSGKPRIKQRIKIKSRSDMDAQEEAAERKAKQARKAKTKDEDWGIDEEEFVDVVDEAATPPDTSNTTVTEAISNELLIADSAEARAAGFKHKRADFKSKRIQHELPASFAEIDNEFTRTLTGGGGRRRTARGAGRRATRRVRTRRIGPAPRVEGQPAQVRLGMTIRDLSVALGVKLQEIMAFLMKQGRLAQVNDILTENDITLVAAERSIPLEWETEEDLERELEQEAQALEDSAHTRRLVIRPPVVTFMGHVDHGKTSLLDRIRRTRVAAGEHGGITQHIGAYSVLTEDGRKITFLDTPGHEAFSAMRARGANLTDVAVLVVAADDGVMPQTEEAAAHARNAGVPVVVAINKCDLPSANPDRVRQELSTRVNLLPEEWGGQVGMVEVSAHTGDGISDLLDRILLEAEVLELKSDPDRPAAGFVIEAKMVEGQGVVATVLVSEGTMTRGDIMLCSDGYGKIRLMYDEFGKSIERAGPGTPVRVSGLSSVPEAGDKFFVMQDLLKARAIADQRDRENRAAAMARRQHVTMENLTAHLAGSGRKDLNIIVKADVVGSLEVMQKTLVDLSTSEVGIHIIHTAVGGVNQADVILADASDAIIVGFNVAADSQAKVTASALGVQIKLYHVIYRLLEDMRAALEGLLPPEEREVVQGHAQIRQVFRASKIGAIAGCFVTDGSIFRTSKIRLYRDNVVIYSGTLQSLRRIKDDAREVKSGFDCGIKISGYDDIRENDVIEAYSIEEIARKL